MVEIDVSDFIEASNEEKTLHFGDPTQQAKFELAICMAIYKWDDLNTAVVNQWGGSDSAEKRDWISGIVIEAFDEKAIDIQYIEEMLLNAMVDEFDVNIDNDSALETAALIIKLYREVAQKNYTTIDTLYAKWEEKQKNKTNDNVKVVIQEDPANPDSDDDDDDDDEYEDEAPRLVDADSMDIDEEPAGPVVDDDGFELVQKKGKGRR